MRLVVFVALVTVRCASNDAPRASTAPTPPAPTATVSAESAAPSATESVAPPPVVAVAPRGTLRCASGSTVDYDRSCHSDVDCVAFHYGSVVASMRVEEVSRVHGACPHFQATPERETTADGDVVGKGQHASSYCGTGMCRVRVVADPVEAKSTPFDAGGIVMLGAFGGFVPPDAGRRTMLGDP